MPTNDRSTTEERRPTRCEICGKGPAPEAGGVTIYRHNKPGEMPARWRCRKDRDNPSPDDDLVDALEGR